MIDPREFLIQLQNRGIDFFAGVPDSLLKNFLEVLSSVDVSKHLVAANEGAALAAACGYHLATGRTPLVYMQNSGLGNAVNPLLSLADRSVYGIPLLLLIGWRGEPGIADEPQHRACGGSMLEMLNCLSIPYSIIAANCNLEDNLNKILGSKSQPQTSPPGPVALLVRKDAFAAAGAGSGGTFRSELTRGEAIKSILKVLPENAVFISTTGYTSRELHLERISRAESSGRDFFNVGAMGHANQIALGIAMSRPDRDVVCLDGDGSLLMHMGALAVIAKVKPANFKHIVFNNFCHESVGAQPTGAGQGDFSRLAQSAGYVFARRVLRGADLEEGLTNLSQAAGPAMLEIVVRTGLPDKLPRPSDDFQSRKREFMQFLSEGSGR